jgi:hypothetical protein
MRTGLGLPSTDAKAPAKGRCFVVVAVLMLGLAVSACVGSSQLANLTETAQPLDCLRVDRWTAFGRCPQVCGDAEG